MGISAIQLIKKFEYAYSNHWGYIYGAAGTKWTQAKQDAAINSMTKKYGQQWVGHTVADCSGLFSWAFKQLGGYMYHGSNTMWKKYCTSQGTITATTKLKPGTAVFLVRNKTDYHHVGLYIGGGKVIEAKGTMYGVVMSDLSHWDTWGELVGVDYDAIDSAATAVEQKPATPAIKGKVTLPIGTSGSTVRLRASASTSGKILVNVPVNSQITILEQGAEWNKITYGTKTGYMMNKFITKI